VAFELESLRVPEAITMKSVILAPFRGDDAERTRNWSYAKEQWAKLALPIAVGDSRGSHFGRAAALNTAAGRAGDWDVALVTDADIALGSTDQANAAIMRAYRTGAYTVAYSVLNYLSDLGTGQLILGDDPSDCSFDSPSIGLTWECCFAVRRDVWDEVGGFDERFDGYGGQGLAFYYAAATFGGRERIVGAAYHMSHPLVVREADPHFPDNVALVARYLEAADDPTAMREVLAGR
jgi:hypothetical protein